ncbi:MAG: helix-turn-helix domain-containing protein [Alicyclobacillus macrosporangiidus]|uniref:helix-turn-helix domain-containing protein n=1 Tax=Alicyclobacillus macrosporangiidus TaxID=392015 RepID=UPI0026F318AC|nr:helix-turn-helix domain-containing protein [Alicyclobacillus macrosporangiidus]MCL6600286.1 helix-turn-helix domain-containing protein [Alicyclobacillus macrosporangiidus]
MGIGDRLSSLRNKTKWTQEDVAKRLGIARTTYAMYEQGRREPDAETLSKLAELYDVTVDYLLGRTSDPKGTAVDPDPVSPEEREFLEWVKEHVTGMFFYDWKKSTEKDAWLRGLRIIYEMEKGRKPGQKQGE